MALHRIMVSDSGAIRPGETVRIGGEEGRHALRVKRLEAGQRVQILDGMGVVAECVVGEPGGRELVLRVEAVERVEPVRPRVEVFAATPKGARADEMVRGLSQVGAASWCPLETKLGVVHPRETKVARLSAIARETAKQCGRAWVLELGRATTPAEVLEGDIIVADASGTFYEARGGDVVRLLIGPEGGWSADEMRLMRDAGARVCSFGTHVMRIEVAAVVAAGIVMDAERRHEGTEARRHEVGDR